MKKTLAALIVGAFAASAANATVIYDNEGTNVELYGSLRLIMEKSSKKTTPVNASSTKESNSALRNAGSRLGFKVKHNLDNDFYALGRVEFRFDDTESRDEFGSLYAKRAYVGLGSKQYGELTFGRQVTIADDLSQANDYEYGFIPKGKYIPTSGTGVVRYDYRGVEGLQLSANYNFGQRHNDKGHDLSTGIKGGFGVGAIYAQDNYDIRFAYGHTNYETGVANTSHRKDGYLASLSYAFGDFKLTGDFGYAHEKNGSAKTNQYYVSPGFIYQALAKSQVYGNYLYEHVKTKDSKKEKTHGFLLGVDYQFHKHVVVFLEGKYLRTKNYGYGVNGGYDYTGKTDDKAIGVGMRVFW
ncbi:MULTISPECIES: porin [unclassified Pasteurella]|uniref:porin n=1 Tax=unclassified Pasteurella TaxID=2621516 RepID=UPI001072F725|nr:porin [Pasteurella sp. 19428wF3_WM03]TFU49668.1 porin [Pasteurella sp. WM03]